MSAFEVMFEGLVRLEIEEVWPDHDAPDKPSAADVVAVMSESDQTASVLLQDWNMSDELTLVVRDIATGEIARFPS